MVRTGVAAARGEEEGFTLAAMASRAFSPVWWREWWAETMLLLGRTGPTGAVACCSDRVSLDDEQSTQTMNLCSKKKNANYEPFFISD